jgi:hypothetical protein
MNPCCKIRNVLKGGLTDVAQRGVDNIRLARL